VRHRAWKTGKRQPDLTPADRPSGWLNSVTVDTSKLTRLSDPLVPGDGMSDGEGVGSKIAAATVPTTFLGYPVNTGNLGVFGLWWGYATRGLGQT